MHAFMCILTYVLHCTLTSLDVVIDRRAVSGRLVHGVSMEKAILIDPLSLDQLHLLSGRDVRADLEITLCLCQLDGQCI